jgi:hypothetical protein
MLLNSWSIALLITSLACLFVIIVATYTAIRILRFWAPGEDSRMQIRLENEIWLSSTLIEYGVFIQIFSLLLLVLAADSFASLLSGAMCATGSFLANDHGAPALSVKLITVFCLAFWILIHRLDICSPNYSLVRFKYIFILLLCPLLITDIVMQTLYLFYLQPDIITSCCGVIFQESEGELLGFSREMASTLAVFFFFGFCLIILFIAFVSSGNKLSARGKRISRFLLAGLSLILYPTGIWIVISFVSPYVYAMPHHRCPFCLIHSEYSYIGYPLFLSLECAVFGGVGMGVLECFRNKHDLEADVDRFQNTFRLLTIFSLLLFLLISLIYPLLYLITGGEL